MNRNALILLPFFLAGGALSEWRMPPCQMQLIPVQPVELPQSVMLKGLQTR